MKKMLITGGTIFVSRYAAMYYAKKYDVYVLNRNTHPQCEGVTLIESDRHSIGEKLKGYHFDVVLDTAYNAADVNDLLDALDSFDDYFLISSSAVYPETAAQPFLEETPTGPNGIWGQYGTDKIAAERALLVRAPGAYVLRPPYLYGPGNLVYREAFVFECARQGRAFYLPGEGEMKLQFFHVEDLYRFVDTILEKRPAEHIFNVGNSEAVSIKEWVELCYQAVGCKPEFVQVSGEVEQRKYFPFHKYDYYLGVEKQTALMPETKPLTEGLTECYAWYQENENLVWRKPLLEYIDQNLRETV